MSSVRWVYINAQRAYGSMKIWIASEQSSSQRRTGGTFVANSQPSLRAERSNPDFFERV